MHTAKGTPSDCGYRRGEKWGEEVKSRLRPQRCRVRTFEPKLSVHGFPGGGRSKIKAARLYCPSCRDCASCCCCQGPPPWMGMLDPMSGGRRLASVVTSHGFPVVRHKLQYMRPTVNPTVPSPKILRTPLPPPYRVSI
jgi:hypothetical protein